MAEITLNGHRVISGEVTLTATRQQHAELVVDRRGGELSGRATLSGPGLTFVGTVDDERTTVFQDTTRVVVVAGAGGLWKDVAAKYYRIVSVETILTDLFREAGETLSTTSDATVLARVLTSWTRAAGDVIDALETLTKHLGVDWRMLEDGTVWVGTHAWAEWPKLLRDSTIVQNDDPRTQMISVAVRNHARELQARPGFTFDGRRVREVRFRFNEGSTRTQLVYGESLAEMLGGIVARNAPDVASRSWYAATVVRQLASGLLEVKPDDVAAAPAGGWTDIPIRSGLPGTSVKVSAGQRVRIFFEDGDRTKPVAALWDEGVAVDEIKFAGGTKSIARVDDTVDCGKLTIIAAAGAAPVVYTPPGGSPVTCGTLAATGLTGNITINLSGKITSGNDRLKG